MRAIWHGLGLGFIVCLIILALASCAPTCPPPKVVTQIVNEPVAVRCIDVADVGTEPASVALPTDARLAADTAAAQAITLRAYVHRLLALIGPCTK